MLNVIRRLISSCTASLSLVIYCKPFWVYFKSLNIYIYICTHIYTHIYLYKFIFGCAWASLLLRLFSSCDKWGYSLVALCWLLTVVVYLGAEHRLGSPVLDYIFKNCTSMVCPCNGILRSKGKELLIQHG